MKIKKRYLYILIFIFLCGLVYDIFHWEHRKPLLEITFFSLNRGRAIFIRTPENKTILIGGGQNTQVIQELTKQMPFYKRSLDDVIIPSATPAQIGGLIEVIDRYEVGEVIMPKIIATSTVLNELMKGIRSKKIHTKEVERGDEVEIAKNLKMKILFPYEYFKFNKTSLPELGIELEYQQTHAFLLGNLSKTIQKDILKNTEIETGENIVEYYNSAGESKAFPELLEKINPQFTWDTKEQTMHVVSNGETWEKK